MGCSLLYSIIGSGYRNCSVTLRLRKNRAFPCTTLYISGDFIAVSVFIILLLLFPLRKFPLTFFAFVVSDDVRQETAGDSFNGILWNI